MAEQLHDLVNHEASGPTPHSEAGRAAIAGAPFELGDVNAAFAEDS